MPHNRVGRGKGEDLRGHTVMDRRSAREKRIEKFGLANQMTHETEGRMQRKAMLEQMAEGKRSAQRKVQKKASQSTGMNAGTVGGSMGSY